MATDTPATILKQPTLAQRQRAERESLILAEAERLLGTEGYEGLVMDRLAELVGISKGTLYQHFANKEDLVGAVILRGLAHLDVRISRLTADVSRPVIERLSAVLTDLIEGDIAWMSTMIGPQKHALSDALANHPGLRDAFIRFFDVLCTLIRQGQASGELDPTIPASVAARFLLSLVRARSGRSFPGETAVSRKKFSALAVRFYVHGLQMNPPTDVNSPLAPQPRDGA